MIPLKFLGIPICAIPFLFPEPAPAIRVQWEYACRAGTTTAYAIDPVDEAGWHDGNTVQRPIGASPMPVGLKKTNAWGLHDMHGNVWEWCLDTDNNSPATTRNIIRGGSWRTGPFSLRSANRASLPPADSLHDLGFRIVLASLP